MDTRPACPPSPSGGTDGGKVLGDGCVWVCWAGGGREWCPAGGLPGAGVLAWDRDIPAPLLIEMGRWPRVVLIRPPLPQRLTFPLLSVTLLVSFGSSMLYGYNLAVVNSPAVVRDGVALLGAGHSGGTPAPC